MNGVPIFSSLPNRIRRFSKSEDDIGEVYREACIDSWRRMGFVPHTINAAAESVSLPEKLSVRKLVVPRDAGEEFPKRLPYLSDFVGKMTEGYRGVVAITNSDIVLDFDPDTLRRIHGLRPGECVILKRQDIDDPDSRQGVEYQHGYDFFAMHTDDLEALRCDVLTFGMPWWDHFLPLWLCFNGVKAVQVPNRIYHLLHDERWDQPSWVYIAARFEQILMSAMQTCDVDGNPYFIDYVKSVDDVKCFKYLPMKKRLSVRLRIGLGVMKPAGQERWFMKNLVALSHLNNRIIDQWILRGVA